MNNELIIILEFLPKYYFSLVHHFQYLMILVHAHHFIPKLQEAFWPCILTISNPETYLDCIMGLRCSQARVILVVISGWLVPTWSAERAHGDVGAEHYQYQKNCGETSPGNLRHGGMRNPIRVGIFTTLHSKYGRHIWKSVEDGFGNLFISSFIWKDNIPLTHHRISKYDVSQ